MEKGRRGGWGKSICRECDRGKAELIWKSGRANEHADQIGGRQGRFDSLPSVGEWGLVIGQINFGPNGWLICLIRG